MNNLKIKNIDCHAALAMTKNAQSGRSMIEMLGVLAIIGVLSVGGIAGYSKAMMKYRINKTIEQITLIAGNVRAFWGPQKNYIGVYCWIEDDGCPIHKKAKIFPDEMITVTDGKIMSITNPFGGGVYLSSEGSYNDAFMIGYFDIPQEACIELASYDWQSAGVSFITTVATGDASAKVPVSVDNAIKLCSLNNADKFEMQFDFDRKDDKGLVRIDTE